MPLGGRVEFDRARVAAEERAIPRRCRRGAGPGLRRGPGELIRETKRSLKNPDPIRRYRGWWTPRRRSRCSKRASATGRVQAAGRHQAAADRHRGGAGAAGAAIRALGLLPDDEDSRGRGLVTKNSMVRGVRGQGPSTMPFSLHGPLPHRSRDREELKLIELRKLMRVLAKCSPEQRAEVWDQLPASFLRSLQEEWSWQALRGRCNPLRQAREPAGATG